MKSSNSIVLLLISATFANAEAGEVRSVCEKTGMPILTLQYRDRDHNLSEIEKLKTPHRDQISFLKKENKRDDHSSVALDLAVEKGNVIFAPESKYKKTFLKFSTEKQKLEDPIGYRAALVDAANDLLPKNINKLPWFLNANDSWIASTALFPVGIDETGEMYGAVTRSFAQSNGKHRVEIVFSNNASEPLPYLIPLLVHELQHASSLISQFKITDHKQKVVFRLIDEAKAFDLQMQAYVSLIRRDPNLFCNWMYVTWAYGEIVAPLSWTMSSMEEELLSGKYMFRYASEGNFSGEDHLLNPKKTDLRKDIRKQISDLKLRFVK